MTNLLQETYQIQQLRDLMRRCGSVRRGWNGLYYDIVDLDIACHEWHTILKEIKEIVREH